MSVGPTCHLFFADVLLEANRGGRSQPGTEPPSQLASARAATAALGLAGGRRMELQPGGADAVLGSGAQEAHALAPRPALPPRHGSSPWRPSSRRPMERKGLWLAQAAELRADPARGRRKRTARARPPLPLLQRAGSTAHTPATAVPRSTAFSPRILRPRAPTLLSRWRTPASTLCSGFAAAR